MPRRKYKRSDSKDLYEALKIIEEELQWLNEEPYLDFSKQGSRKKKRPLNSWQKFVKANSKKRKFRFKDGKLKLKSMGIAYRKTAAYKRSKK